MKRFVAYVLAAAFMAAIAVYVAASLGVSAQQRSQTGCSGINVIIADSLKNSLVSKEDVISFLGGNPGKYLGKQLDEINLKEIEETLDGRSAILKSEAYATKDGFLNIEITQRTPIVRFGSVYSDAGGYLFPVREGHSADVPEVDGSIPLKVGGNYRGEARSPEEREWVNGMIAMISYMERNRREAAGFRKMYVRENGDLVLFPDNGTEQFIFGKPDDIAGKFRKIRRYYSKIVPEKGAETYSSVNLKYRGQIICRK